MLQHEAVFLLFFNIWCCRIHGCGFESNLRCRALGLGMPAFKILGLLASGPRVFTGLRSRAAFRTLGLRVAGVDPSLTS